MKTLDDLCRQKVRKGAHQGMSRPILVHLVFVMKKPTMGSVTAPQALPMNRTMEAWKALICRVEQREDDN